MEKNKLTRHLLEFKKPYANLFLRLNKLAQEKNKSRNQIILELLTAKIDDDEKLL